MDFNLSMLNLWIGLCKGAPGLPRHIRELAYREHSIEQVFRNQDGEQCNPELIVSSEAQSHSMLFEWKSGPNTERDQLRRYSRITPVELRALAFLSPRAAKGHDVVIVGPAEHAERLKIGIQEGGYPFPLLVADDVGLHLALNRFSCPLLNTIFAPTLKIDFGSAPMSFVPISEASEPWEVADVVIPKLLERMLRRDTTVRASTLGPEIFPLWEIMQKPARSAAKRCVCNILYQAAQTEFLSFLSCKSLQDDCAIELVNNPINQYGDKRGGAFKRLKHLQKEFKERLMQGREFVREPSLWDFVQGDPPKPDVKKPGTPVGPGES